jgi:hypothetical protein
VQFRWPSKADENTFIFVSLGQADDTVQEIGQLQFRQPG